MKKELAEQNKILKIVAGSQLYGTNTPESDEDYSGIFIAWEDVYFGIETIKGDEIDLSVKNKLKSGKNSSDATDYKLYEIKNFVKLALSNNPNIIEHLFVNEKNILFINEFGRNLLENAHLFPNKGAYDKFIGYANSQKHKMIIKLENYEKLSAAKEFLEKQDPNEFIVMFRDNDKIKDFFVENGSHFVIGDLNFQKHLMVKKALRSLNERLGSITNRTELVRSYGYDTKFASHLIRLLLEGRDLMQKGKLEFPLENADFLLDIKKGKYELNEILEFADKYEKELSTVKEKSSLPDKPDMVKINILTKSIIMNFFGLY